jgi:hypothetical protein
MAGDGSAGRFNWRRIATFSTPWANAAGTLVSSFGEMRSHYESDTWGENPSAALGTLPATNGLSLKAHSSNTDMATGSSTSNDYFPFALAALSYAADHSAPDADNGYLRVTSASNYSAWSALTGRTQYAFNIAPRRSIGLPSWLSGRAVMQWTQVTGTMASAGIAPSPLPPGITGVRSVTDAWCGAAVRQSSGHYIIHGGGHGDYSGNEIYALDLMASAPVWARIWGPTPNAQITSLTNHYADGNPASIHTYYGLQWDETGDRLLRMLGGQYITSGTGANCDAWPWQATNWSPAGTIPAIPSFAGGQPACVMDPATGNVYLRNNAQRARWTRTSNTWSANSFSSQQAQEGAWAFDTARRCVWGVGDRIVTSGVLRWNVDDDTFSGNGSGAVAVQAVTGNGTGLLSSFGHGAAYDPINDCVWVLPSSGVLHKFDPAALTLNTQATSGAGPGSNSSYGNGTGPYNRLRYVEALKGLVYTPSWNAPTFFIRTS